MISYRSLLLSTIVLNDMLKPGTANIIPCIMNIYGVMIQSNEPDGFMLRLICVFLGCDLPIRLLLKSLSSKYDRLEYHFHHV